VKDIHKYSDDYELSELMFDHIQDALTFLKIVLGMVIAGGLMVVVSTALAHHSALTCGAC
jgi:hypothetical protein